MFDGLDEIRDWLELETKAILSPESPQKAVAIGTEGYSLLLLNKGSDEKRIYEIVESIRDRVAGWQFEYPFVVARHLTLDNAVAGQCALACCDSVSAFVRDEIVDEGAESVFRQLHEEVMQSSEFESIAVRVNHVPDTEAGRRFRWQFFGLAGSFRTPAVFHFFRKKARMITHWSAKVGAIVELDFISVK